MKTLVGLERWLSSWKHVLLVGNLSLIPNTHIELPLTPAPSKPPRSSNYTYKTEILKKIFAQPLKPTRILSPWQPCEAVKSSLLGNVCTMLPTWAVPVYIPHCLHELSSGALETIIRCSPQSRVHLPLGSPGQRPGLTLARSSWPSTFHNTIVWFTSWIV